MYRIHLVHEIVSDKRLWMFLIISEAVYEGLSGHLRPSHTVQSLCQKDSSHFTSLPRAGGWVRLIGLRLIDQRLAVNKTIGHS
jgi:hypothetical protein